MTVGRFSTTNFMNSLIINPNEETKKIVNFIQTTLEKTGLGKIVVGVSGGVDSAIVLSLCVKVAGAGNVYALMMPNGEINKEDKSNTDKLFKLLGLPKENRLEINISPIVNNFKFLIFPLRPRSEASNFKSIFNNKTLNDKNKNELIRLGNVMARVRMMVLYDFAKANSCLVGGTENKSEYLLGYYTRFGDEASDLEPIRHLYKTQVYQLAKYLEIPEKIIQKKPTAGLWEGQTDKTELGFSYSEADKILSQHFENKIPWGRINFKKREEIVDRVQKRVEGNWFKKETPYFLK